MIRFDAHMISVTQVCRSGDALRATASDGVTLETPAAGHRESYIVPVGEVVWSGGRTWVQILFAKEFDIPACT